MSHLAKILVIALAAAAQLPCAALADDLSPDALLAPPGLSWTDLPGAVTAAPQPLPALPVFATYDDGSDGLLSLDPESPGLQFSLDPDNEELFIGWRFEF